MNEVKAYQIGDEVVLRGNSVVDDILKVVGMRKMVESDLMAYKVKFPNGCVGWYDETQLSLKPYLNKKRMKDNKLIAEFWGMVLGEDGTMYYDDVENLFPPTPFYKLKFHESWDWLMEVVNKIKRTDLSREMVMQGIDELITEIDDSFDFNIAITYDAVVKFIEEYNKVKRNELQSL